MHRSIFMLDEALPDMQRATDFAMAGRQDRNNR
jgi:hypothetical protein